MTMSPHDDDQLPEYSEQDERGDEGMRIVERIVGEDLRWVFRDQTRRDFGIDCLIEIVDERRRATGRLIAAQIKCGDSYFRETTPDEGVVYRGTVKHLNYWLGHSLPVIVILCQPEASTCVYAPITQGSIRRTKAGWTTVVPLNQSFGASAAAALLRMAEAPQRADVIQLSLLRFLVERWGDRLRIATVIESPRDWHWFPFLIEVSGETGGMFGVQFIDTAMRALSIDTLAGK